MSRGPAREAGNSLPHYTSLDELIEAESLTVLSVGKSAEENLVRKGVSVMYKKYPWSPSSRAYVQEVYLMLRKHVDPWTWVHGRKGIVFGGESWERLRNGDRVAVRLVSPNEVGMGVCRWIGRPRPMAGSEESENQIALTAVDTGGNFRMQTPKFDCQTTWLGIQMDRPLGRHDGVVNGLRYFRTPPNHAVFVPPHQVSLARETSWEGVETLIHTPDLSSARACIAHRPILAFNLSYRGGSYRGYRYQIEFHSDRPLAGKKEAFAQHLREYRLLIHPTITSRWLALWSAGEDPVAVLDAEIRRLWCHVSAPRPRPSKGKPSAHTQEESVPAGLSAEDIKKQIEVLDEQSLAVRRALGLVMQSKKQAALDESPAAEEGDLILDFPDDEVA
ncbi:hypothetical protein DIPPA_07177 [Diplonema papillatum]|nr:hypothetical protein DIPPA_07177 [Diplonema papillatum]